jgi:cytidylate kinase
MGSGKGTVARLVARALGFRHVDTGAMYRAVAWKALREGVPLDDLQAVAELARRTRVDLDTEPEGNRVWCDGEDVTDAIRSVQVNAAVRRVAANAGVRSVLTERQRSLAREGGVVVEGRDIGTVVLPDADLKVYLVASLDERARRRWQELRARGEDVSLEAVRELVREDDEAAQTRAVAPLRRAEDAVVVDSTSRSPEEVAEEIARLVRSRVARGG